MINTEINSRFREVLEASGLSQEKFGIPLGMTRSEVKNIVYDKTDIKPAKIPLLCKAYRIRESWFLAGEGPRDQPEDLGRMIGQIAREASGSREEVEQFFARLQARIKTDEELTAEIMLMYAILKRRFGPLLEAPQDEENR